MDAGAAGRDHRYPDERPFPPNHHHVLETLAGDARETTTTTSSSALGEESTSTRPGGGGAFGAVGLGSLVHLTKAFDLRPRRYFVAWSGVLTLALEGWPEHVTEMKQRMQENFPGLCSEAFGSKWPKVSLGCLTDGRILSRDELRALDGLCAELSSGKDFSEAMLGVDRLELVLFACRSLEQRLTTTKLWLGQSPSAARSGEKVSTDVTESVLAERSDDSYWDGVARPGNREHHYRERAWGATLVAPLGSYPSPQETDPPRGPGSWSDERAAYEKLWREQRLEFLCRISVSEFRRKVDALLPGAYVWFSEESLHVTVRGLFG